MIQAAHDLHRQGRLAEAESAYRSVLAKEPEQFEALHGLGVLKLQQGNAAEAATLITRALARWPDAPAALSNLGTALMALNRHAEALAAYDRILAMAPTDLDAHYGRGAALIHLGRHPDALASFEQVLAARSDHVGALFYRGSILAGQGRHADALTCYDQVLRLHPDLLPAVQNRGNVLVRLGRSEEALVAFARVIAAMPGNLEAQNGKAIALRELGRQDEALATCDRILARDPDYQPALITRGNVLLRLSRPAEALACFDQVLAQHPDDVTSLNNRGFALSALNRQGEALASFAQALAIDPGHAETLNNQGIAFDRLGRIDEAIDSYSRALTIAPQYIDALNNYAQALSRVGRLEEAIAVSERALAVDPKRPATLSLLAQSRLASCHWDQMATLAPKLARAVEADEWRTAPFLLLALFDDPALQLRGTRQYVQRTLVPHEPVWDRTLPRDGKVRIAYLSAHFRTHPSSYLMAELFELHDRTRFDVLGVSYGFDDSSAIRARVAAAFDEFHDVSGQSDEDAALLIRERKPHIVIDLTGHTENGRVGILARRPAPVQVSYMGYPGTMGAPFIDYLIADKTVIPVEHEPHYDEKIVRLPHTYWVTDSSQPVPLRIPERAEAGLPETGFVFCCFNNSWKITAPVFDVWMRLLGRVEGSVLWLLGASDVTADSLRAAAQVRGIDPGRLVFAPRQEHADHLARHRLADLFLDTLPYNAHTTASDALWLGVPVVTCRGKSFVGRVAASELGAAGLPELVTTTLSDYETLALKLATEPSALAAVRARLADNRATCPLFDTRQFTRHIEAAFATMWDIWKRGDGPRSFDVEPIAS